MSSHRRHDKRRVRSKSPSKGQSDGRRRMRSPSPHSNSRFSGKKVNFRSSSTQNVTDEPPESNDNNDEEYVDPDLVDYQSTADEEYEDESNLATDKWGNHNVVGSANLIAEANSDEEMFPVSQDDIDKWRKHNKNYSSWMTDNQVAFII